MAAVADEEVVAVTSVDGNKPAKGEPAALPALGSSDVEKPAVSRNDAFFHKGIAISVWQNSGGDTSNWGRFTERKGGCCALLQFELLLLLIVFLPKKDLQ
jgi:hypothetical protein